MIGINYHFKSVDLKHNERPNLPIISSENCATGTTRGWYYDNCPQKGYISAYDHDTDEYHYCAREFYWKSIMERPFIMGGYQWDAFYQNQSHWLTSPMIHMLPHWNVDVTEGESVKVFVYTNCEEAELVLNGKSLGRRKCESFTHLEWDVPYEKGKIEAIGYNAESIVAREMHETASDAKKLVLKVENQVKEARDIAIVTCYTVDGEGRFVPTASPEVEFFTNSSGEILGTGSDISDHNPVPFRIRKMREGYISVAVGVATEKGRYPEKVGTVELYAKSPGLESAKISIVFESLD